MQGKEILEAASKTVTFLQNTAMCANHRMEVLNSYNQVRTDSKGLGGAHLGQSRAEEVLLQSTFRNPWGRCVLMERYILDWEAQDGALCTVDTAGIHLFGLQCSSEVGKAVLHPLSFVVLGIEFRTTVNYISCLTPLFNFKTWSC